MNMAIRVNTLLTHTSSFSNEDIILNRDLFSFIQVGDFIRIVDISDNKVLVIKVASLQNARLEISLNKTVADAMNIKQYAKVYVEKVNPSQYEVDYVELTFKKQFIQRGNMWKFKKLMYGRSGESIFILFQVINPIVSHHHVITITSRLQYT